MLEKPCAVISYADEGMSHFGYIYQACNFIYTGTTLGAEMYVLNNGKIISKRALDQQPKTKEEINTKVDRTKKHRYFYFLGSKKQVKEMRKALKYEIFPYPKGETKRYNTSYQPKVQGLLF